VGQDSPHSPIQLNWNVVIDAEELVGNVTKDDFIYLAVKLVSDL
jgi:hypothetical protein